MSDVKFYPRDVPSGEFEVWGGDQWLLREAGPQGDWSPLDWSPGMPPFIWRELNRPPTAEDFAELDAHEEDTT